MTLIAVMGVMACKKEAPDFTDNSTPTNGDYITFTANFGELASKTAATYDDASKKLTLSWEAGDQVGVYSSQTPILFKASAAGASTTLTSNVKVASASSYSAVFPYMTDALMEVRELHAEQIHSVILQYVSNSALKCNLEKEVSMGPRTTRDKGQGVEAFSKCKG